VRFYRTFLQQSVAILMCGVICRAQQPPPVQSSQPSAQDLQQLVAPIALYPDELLAQVLAASTYPDQVVAADQWIKQNRNLQGDQLVNAVNNQQWDGSVKGLTQFPSVLDQMAGNLSWTSALGDAYYNDQANVMAAVQAMRRRAKDAGTLNSTSQQVVKQESSTIIIEPAQPTVVYVPTYSPAVVYGAPVPAYPGYSGWDMAAASIISFGAGMAVGAAISGGWGYHGWGCNWHGGTVVYNHNTYVSTSNTFVNRNYNVNNVNRNNVNVNNVNRNNINNTNVNRNNVNANNVNRNNANVNAANANRNNSTATNFNRAGNPNFNSSQHPQTSASNAANRGYGQTNHGVNTSAYSGVDHGGQARAESNRGRSSVSGGGSAPRSGARKR
jgi:hypothetical protein